jgi:hypothetical protein
MKRVFGVETEVENEYVGIEAQYIFVVTDKPVEIAKIPGFRSAALLGDITNLITSTGSLFKVNQENCQRDIALSETYHLAEDATELFRMGDVIYIEKLEPVVFL